MEKVKFTDIFEDVTKYGRKIPTDGYFEEGKYPIIDQGQNQIAGYTNEELGLFENIPAIIFGDHTRIIKFITTPFFLGADGVKVLKSTLPNVDYKYLYYALLNIKIPDTGYNRHFKWLKESEITLPTLEEQKAIADKLDKVSGLIEKRKAQLEKLDLLIKSQFIEMFDGKNFPEMSLDELSFGKGEYGAQSASIPYDKNRPRYVRITDINDDGTLNEDFVSSINTEDDLAYKLSEGDFLFARMGATVGKTYAYKKGNEIFAGYLIRYKLNCQMIVPEYLFWFTKTPTYLTWVKLNQSGAAQPGINAKKYGSLRIPIPPIEEQRRFTRFVEQTDKSKFEIQKSLEKLEILKKSLMQNYFG